MKDLTKYFIDLSKCTEEQRKHIISMLPEPSMPYFLEINKQCFILAHRYSPYNEWIVGVEYFKDGKTELTYPDFIKLFEGGEGEILPDVAYWRNRCLLAEKCLSESPCDPDITNEQIKAHNSYNEFIEAFGNKD